MVEELQAFAEGQKRELAELRRAAEEGRRGSRAGQARVRALEGELLAAQDARSKLDSQVCGCGCGCGCGIC